MTTIIILLVPLWCNYRAFAQRSGIIYVKPQEGATNCPGQPCKTLEEYVTSDQNDSYSNLTVILLEGRHRRTYRSYNYNHGIQIPHVIQVIGYGLPNRTIIENMSVTPKEIIMDGFTLEGSKLSTVSNAQIIYRNIKITRCIFNDSTIILFNVYMTISNSIHFHIVPPQH